MNSLKNDMGHPKTETFYLWSSGKDETCLVDLCLVNLGPSKNSGPNQMNFQFLLGDRL